MLKKCIIFFFFFPLVFLFSEDGFLSLRGYLGREELAPIEKKMEDLKQEGGLILIQLSSSSGDLNEVFRIAQELSVLKAKWHKYIIVYIQGRAVGPAAIIPFLADEIMTTPIVAWGDIPYGLREEVGLNLIRTLVKGIIHAEEKRTHMLHLLVDAMVDPHYQLIFEKDQEVIGKTTDEQLFFDPLILNRKNIESLNLLNKILTDEEFYASYISEEIVQNEEEFKTEQIVDVMTPLERQKKFEEYLPYNKEGDNLVGYLTIGNDRPIDQSTFLYVKFALEYFKKQNVRFIVLHLNTPGGEVLSTLKIVELLQKADISDHIPTIAFIQDWAVSAGAMLAYSSRFIGIVPTSIMGAAEPVIIGGEGRSEPASEKVNSALRAEFVNLAQFYGRNPILAEAMVDKDMIVVIRNHKIVQLSSESEIRIGVENPDIILSKPGKLLTLHAKQLVDLGVADFAVSPTALPSLTKEEQREGRWSASKNLVFEQPYLAKIPNASIITYSDWRVAFFSILSHPVVASLLFMGLILGFYIEISTPGFGIPGIIGLICLSLIILSSIAIHAINLLEIIILAVGLILLALELFVIPGFGIAGVLGIILTIVGLFALMLPGLGKIDLLDFESFRLMGATFIEKLAYLCGALILSIIAILFLAKLFSRPFFRSSPLVLRGEQESKKGFVAGILQEKMPQKGEMGETITPLRPSGKVHIGENFYDAMTQSGYLEKGVAIEVVRIEGSKLVVRPLENEENKK